MSNIDKAELIRILTTTPRRPQDFSVAPPAGVSGQQSRELQALREQIQSILVKAGFNFERMTTLAQQNRMDARRIFKQQQSEVAKQLPKKKAALLKALADRRSAVGSLSFGSTPAEYYLLEEPILIMQQANTQVANVESAVVPNNSWIKVLIDTNPTVETRHQSESLPPQPDGITFTFYYAWQNENSFAAVINISTFLILTGAYELDSEGDKVTLSVEASLVPLEWWTQPPDVPIAEQSQTQSVLNVSAQPGGGFWNTVLSFFSDGSIDTETGTVSARPIELNYTLFSVPPNEMAMFEVNLTFAYNYPPESNAGDRVRVDFASGDNSIICPFFLVEVLPSNWTMVNAPDP